jgi:hypothetical protein
MDLLVLIAKAADICLKPWSHAVVAVDPSAPAEIDDLNVRIECRDGDGVRWSERDLDLEIYRSGQEINMMLSWTEQPERPMLWHGRHPVWMDGTSGQRTSAPQDAAPLEALGRRLRSLLPHD